MLNMTKEVLHVTHDRPYKTGLVGNTSRYLGILNLDTELVVYLSFPKSYLHVSHKCIFLELSAEPLDPLGRGA